MKYRRLGSTGIKVSVVGVGTWQYGGEWGRDYMQSEVDEILDTAQELGINLIDTAECYGDHISEGFIGDFFCSAENARIGSSPPSSATVSTATRTGQAIGRQRKSSASWRLR